MVDAYFAAVVPHVEKALRQNPYTEWDLPGLWQACATRQALLFVDDEHARNAMVGRLVSYTHAKAFYIMFVGGEGGCDWRLGLAAIREAVKPFGVTEITCHPREGWAKLFELREVARLCVIEE